MPQEPKGESKMDIQDLLDACQVEAIDSQEAIDRGDVLQSGQELYRRLHARANRAQGTGWDREFLLHYASL
jgi:hypothetical protein